MSRNFEEIEGKFLEVEPAAVDEKIKAIGGLRQYKKLFRRYVFDFPDLRLNENNSWLRVRDEGDKVTMAFKHRTDVKRPGRDGGMKEVEIVVNDFEKAAELLRSAGMEVKFYEENWRTLYKLDDIELCLDEWPLIPPYLEIEADSWQKVDGTALKLGLDPAEKLVCATMQVYARYGINELDYKILTFEKQQKN